MDSIYLIQIVFFVQISNVRGYTGSRENTMSDSEMYSLRINLQNELNFIKEQIISETKIRMNLDRDVSRMNSHLRVLNDETQSIKNENNLLKKQIEDSVKDNVQLKKRINETEEDNTRLKKQINEIREDNIQLKVRMSAEKNVSVRWHEDIANALNVTMARTERFNAAIASIQNDDQIHNLTEIISQYRNYTSDKLTQSDFNNELLANFTILEGQLREMKVRLNEQENLSSTTDEKLKTIAENFKEYDATLSSMEITVDEIIGHFRRYSSQDCLALLRANMTLKDGVYEIYPVMSDPKLSVFCDMTNGGWTVFQTRKDGSTDFYRGWNDYREGFGVPDNEYWLGNKYLHFLTEARHCVLRIDMINWYIVSRYAQYNDFRVQDEAGGFTLHIGNYSGNAGRDSLSYHNGMKFTTKDRDQDRNSGNCAVSYTGAWWYNNCHYSNLNGNYSQRNDKGVRWYMYPSSNFMKYTAMKLRCD